MEKEQLAEEVVVEMLHASQALQELDSVWKMELRKLLVLKQLLNNGIMNPSALASAICIRSRSQMTRILKALEDSEPPSITATRNESDHRKIDVDITKNGIAFLQKYLQIRIKHIVPILEDPTAEQEAITSVSFMKKISEKKRPPKKKNVKMAVSQ